MNTIVTRCAQLFPCAVDRTASMLNLCPRDLAAWSILLQQWRHYHGRGRPVATAGNCHLDFAAAMQVSQHVRVALGPSSGLQTDPGTSSHEVTVSRVQMFAECMSFASTLSPVFAWNNDAFNSFSELKSSMLLSHVEGLSDHELVTGDAPYVFVNFPIV
jgi:hypothetical protein